MRTIYDMVLTLDRSTKLKDIDMKNTTITVRLDPKTRYGLELIARQQHRNLSSVVNWVLHQAILNAFPDIAKLWDVDDATRLKKLKLHKPELLSYEEEKLLARLED